MVDSTVNIQSKQRGDITPQIISYAELYGSSDTTNQSSTASSRTLQYATGSTVQKPVLVPIKTAPQNLTFQNPAGVGLFGAEMVVIRFDVNILDSGKITNCAPPGPDSYAPACLHLIDEGTVNTYEELLMNVNLDLGVVNTYEPAEVGINSSEGIWKPMVSVSLENLGSGNPYQDCWVDAYFLNEARSVMPQSEFWTPATSTFYLSISARNTKRLPYNLKVRIGDQVTSINDLTHAERTDANIVN